MRHFIYTRTARVDRRKVEEAKFSNFPAYFHCRIGEVLNVKLEQI